MARQKKTPSLFCIAWHGEPLAASGKKDRAYGLVFLTQPFQFFCQGVIFGEI